jgi:hypothetical protein
MVFISLPAIIHWGNLHSQRVNLSPIFQRNLLGQFGFPVRSHLLRTAQPSPRGGTSLRSKFFLRSPPDPCWGSPEKMHSG